MRKIINFLSIATLLTSSLYAASGKKVFETYCCLAHSNPNLN